MALGRKARALRMLGDTSYESHYRPTTLALKRQFQTENDIFKVSKIFIRLTIEAKSYYVVQAGLNSKFSSLGLLGAGIDRCAPPHPRP